MSWLTLPSLFFFAGLPLVQAQRYSAENIGPESGDVGHEPVRSLTPATANQLSTYHIGCGDTLQIMVWKEPDASVPAVIVRPDGKIAIPLLKEVAVAGLTPSEAE